MKPETSSAQTIRHSHLHKDSFLSRLCDWNTLDTLQYWLFDNGMHFLDSCQWWNKNKLRLRPHEGIDLVSYLDNSGRQRFFRHSTIIPPLFEGVAVHSHDDFLGQTLYIRHEQYRHNSHILYSLYAHVALNSSLPEKITKETPIATIAEVPDTSLIRPHLHITIAWIEEKQKLSTINWQNIVECKSIRLLDPMDFIVSSPEIINSLL